MGPKCNAQRPRASKRHRCKRKICERGCRRGQQAKRAAGIRHARAAEKAQSVRAAARLFMDNKRNTLMRILEEHDFYAKIAPMSR